MYECVDPTSTTALAEVSRWHFPLAGKIFTTLTRSDKSLRGWKAAQPPPQPGHEEVTPQASTTLVDTHRDKLKRRLHCHRRQKPGQTAAIRSNASLVSRWRS